MIKLQFHRMPSLAPTNTNSIIAKQNVAHLQVETWQTDHFVRFGSTDNDGTRPNNPDFEALLAIIKTNDMEALERYIQDGKSVNATTYGELYPIELAASKSPVEMVKRLIDAGAWLMEKTHFSCTGKPLETIAEKALSYARMNQKMDTYFLILNTVKARFSPLLYNQVLDAELRSACFDTKQNALPLVKYLLSEGANPNYVDPIWGLSPLGQAARSNPKLAFFLLSLPEIDLAPEIPPTAFHKNTVLHSAAESDNPDLIKAIVKRKKELLEERNRNRLTPLQVAIADGKYKAARVLVEAGANTNAHMEYGSSAGHMTMLTQYALMGDFERVNMLLALGADPQFKDLSPFSEWEISLLASAGVNTMEKVREMEFAARKTTQQILEERIKGVENHTAPVWVHGQAPNDIDEEKVKTFETTLEKMMETPGDVESNQAMLKLLGFRQADMKETNQQLKVWKQMIELMTLHSLFNARKPSAVLQ